MKERNKNKNRNILKKKKICILTTIRSEYGLLKNLIKKLSLEEDIDLRIVVTGAHLSSDFGNTYKEIENDGIKIDKKIEITLDISSSIGISNVMSEVLVKFTKYFNKGKFDLLIVLGDRYETFAVVIAAMLKKMPIAHIHGGEITLGAIDDVIRHSITKFSHIHFPSTEEYRKRIIQLGENPNTVFNVGALGVENIKKLNVKTKEELSNKFNINFKKKYAILIYHPVTLSNISIEEQINIIIDAIFDSINDGLNYIIIGANADKDGNRINELFNKFANNNKENVFFYKTMTYENYLSLLKNAEFIIGNSSSGILEAPSFKISTINIGDRQGGRIAADSVISVDLNKKEISKAIEKSLYDNEFKSFIKTIKNPYEGNNTSDEIISIIKKILNDDSINLKKKFYDLN